MNAGGEIEILPQQTKGRDYAHADSSQLGIIRCSKTSCNQSLDCQSTAPEVRYIDHLGILGIPSSYLKGKCHSVPEQG